MLKTMKRTLDCKFASLYALQEESSHLKCLWTSDGEPDKDIFIAMTNSTQLAARVFRRNEPITQSLTENNEAICPDFDGFGNVHVMGVPIRDGGKQGDKVGVLTVYRDRSKSQGFDDMDLRSAELMTSIAANTLKNVSLLKRAGEKEAQSQKILSIIDEMSGDVSGGYRQIVTKLVRKVRSLVTCQHIDFWMVDFARNVMKCEVGHSETLQDMVIERSKSHVLGFCALTGKYVKIDDARFDIRYSAEKLRYCKGDSVLVIPVRVEIEREPIGVIVAIDKVPRSSSQRPWVRTGKLVKLEDAMFTYFSYFANDF